MRFLKKFIKNKVLVLSVSVIVVSFVYIGIQKAIDNYNFESNSDIIQANGEDTLDKNDRSEGSFSNETDGGVQEKNGDNLEDSIDSVEVQGAISNEETNLELEELSEDSGSEDMSVGVGGELEAKGKIYVYITGEVNVPGVVILNEGCRIVDAINAAGGTTAKANISKVNLVYVLDDGMKVNIPNDKDLKDNPNFEYITMNSGDGAIDDYFSIGGDVGVSDSSTDSTSAGIFNKYSIVNINTATQTELETLPGIGPSLALKIINYRKEIGKFSSIEQIKDVSGIGESKFESLKNYITI